MPDAEALLIFAVPFVSYVGFNLGCAVRERVHVLLPWKDPVTLILFTVALWPGIATLFGREDIAIIDAGSLWYIATVLWFMVFYTTGYLKTDFSCEYIDIHTIRSDAMPYGGDEVKMLVYYRHDGALYMQEQSFRSILKTLIFRVRSPLVFPLGQIQRRRDVYVSKVLLPTIYVSVVDVAVETITEDEVKVGPFKFTRRSYKYDPEPSCMANCTAWLADAIALQTSKVQLIRQETELILLRAQNQTETIANGVNLVKGLIEASDISQETVRETIEDLTPDDSAQLPPENRVRRAVKQTAAAQDEPQEEEPKPKMRVFAKAGDAHERQRPRAHAGARRADRQPRHKLRAGDR